MSLSQRDIQKLNRTMDQKFTELRLDFDTLIKSHMKKTVPKLITEAFSQFSQDIMAGIAPAIEKMIDDKIRDLHE